MLQELRDELAQMRNKIEGAEERADVAQQIADNAEQRADAAQRAADAAEQRAVAAQYVADTTQAKHTKVEEELRNANVAFQEERATRMQEVAAAQQTIGELRQELQSTSARVLQQGTVVDNVAGLGTELRQAKETMELQRIEMQQLGDVADDMIDQVGDLTDAFHQIDAERGQANVVNPNLVNSTPVHVQGTPHVVKEPAEHVQAAPSSSVINLVSEETGGRKTETVQEYVQRQVEERMRKVREESRLRQQSATVPTPAMADSSSAQRTTNDASTSGHHRQLHEPTPHADPSSQFAAQIGSFVPPSAAPHGNADVSDVNRPPTVQEMSQETVRPRVIVDRAPRLPSGTQRAIENIVQAHLERLGINEKPNERHESVTESTAGNVPNPGPESSRFTFPDLRGNTTAPNPQGQTVFATAQWRPKEPPSFSGAAHDDVYLWTSLMRQYFVFMNGSARQEVAFAATLLRGAAHEWYMGYERRNGNQPPRDWPTLMQAILDRFGSNIRAQEALSRLMNISQGKRSVREYTSEFETLLGRLSTRDESTWKDMYVWGLQPHLARAVALKYPTTIAQAAGHAEATELAIKASQRPGIGAQTGARSAGNFSGRGGSQSGPKTMVQGRGRTNAGQNQRGGRGSGGRRGGGWNRGRQGGSQNRTAVQCYNCGQYGHYAGQCPKGASGSGSSSTGQSVNQRTAFAQNRGGSRGARGGSGGNRRGGNRRTRFSGLSVVYDADGFEYQVDDDGNIVLDFEEEEDAATSQQNNKNQGN